MRPDASVVGRRRRGVPVARSRRRESARTWLTFVAQRLSVAVQLSVAQEAAETLGLSVAADPRAR